MDKCASLLIKDAEEVLKKTDISEIKGETLLITGASGLIGVHMLSCLWLAKKKMKLPFQLYALVNREPQCHVQKLMDYSGAEIIQGDLSDFGFCQSLPKADLIIHTASYGQPIRFMENPIKTLKLNTLATYALLEKLNIGGKFLFISTSEVYTGLTDPPFSENDIGTTNPSHPRSCYIEAKRCGEAIINAYRKDGADAKSARLALAYGPGTRMDDKRAISSFIQKGFEGKINLLDQGKAKRAFLFVTDAVEIFWKILLQGKEPLYNVGGVGERSIADMALAVGKMMNVPVVFPSISQEVKGAPEEAWLNMSKVKNEFGKSDFVSLEEGLARTIEWYRALYGVQ